MKLQTIVVLLITLLNGCVFNSGPEGNQEFYNISHLIELEGVYKNKGEPSDYLSATIWENAVLNENPDVNHEDIELIEVSETADSLILKAIKNDCSIYEKTYIVGRDFKISDGKIILRRNVDLLTRGSGDVLLGPSYEKITLGLDSEKHGKYRSSAYAAGIVFMFLPIAVSGNSDVRFERVKGKPQGFKACSGR